MHFQQEANSLGASDTNGVRAHLRNHRRRMRGGESRGRRSTCRGWEVKEMRCLPVVLEGKQLGDGKGKGEAAPEKPKEECFQKERPVPQNKLNETVKLGMNRKQGWSDLGNLIYTLLYIFF